MNAVIKIECTLKERATRTDNGPGLTGLPHVLVGKGLEAVWPQAFFISPDYKIGGNPAFLLGFEPTGARRETGEVPGNAYPDASRAFPARCGGGFAASVVRAETPGTATFLVAATWTEIVQGNLRWARSDLEAAYRLGLNPLPRIRAHNQNRVEWASTPAEAVKAAAKLGDGAHVLPLAGGSWIILAFGQVAGRDYGKIN